MARKPLPYVEAGLLEYLKLCFPDKCPHPDMTDREIWCAVGAQQVIQKLAALHNNPNPDPGLTTLNA